MERALIISNTSPLINFSEIGRLDLLHEMLGEIVIPPAVLGELVAKTSIFPKAAEACSGGLFPVVAPEDLLLVKSLSTTLHPGEAECLALAMERPGSLLLFDDLAARDAASNAGCRFAGTVGLLIQAKRNGLVPQLLPMLLALRARACFWISDRLFEQALERVGESS
jgi:predicted nucleic acid-binding protein